MEHSFERSLASCLDVAMQETQNSEQTQELKLPEGMPDVGSILSVWGQVVLRGKEWRGDCVAISGGIMVWLLYLPENGAGPECLDSWIPFQMNWDLPEDTPEGEIRVQCLLRSADARSVSARKIMVRTGISAMATAFVPRDIEIAAPEKAPQGAELLRSTYPLRLWKEAGEKTFVQDGEPSLPDSVPRPEKLISYRVEPRLTDQKVLADKVVFRGNTNLHVLYRGEDGQLYSWEFELPFSQYAPLKGEYSAEAAADFQFCSTSVELELDEHGSMRFRCGMTAQYLIQDKYLLALVEDAYSPGRELKMSREFLCVPVVLETRKDSVYTETTVPGDVNLISEVWAFTEFPRITRREDLTEISVSGTVQFLGYGSDGALHSAASHWDGTQSLKADPESRLAAIPMQVQAQAMAGNGSVHVKVEAPSNMTVFTNQQFPMVTGVEIGDPIKAAANRPSVILCRAGDKRLWDLAKEAGSTVSAIQSINNLKEEPAPNQLLLIPVP